MAKARLHPTKVELGILRVLWQAGPLSVRAVQTILNETKETDYTNVLKTMQIRTDKGLVERDDSQRPHTPRRRAPDKPTHNQPLPDPPPRAVRRGPGTGRGGGRCGGALGCGCRLS